MNLTTVQLTQLKKLLQAEALQLEGRLADFTHPQGSAELSLPQHAGDGESRAQTDVLNDEAISQAERLQVALGEVRRALNRIDGGNYGTCTACGEDIAFARLQASASTALCIACQRAAELQRAS